ncbi:MAG: hypothetical protein K2P14_03135 [Anaeroplasmataceae bacterium]|nr:hypothetical protein [Anaeroplasmataceae bacterium]
MANETKNANAQEKVIYLERKTVHVNGRDYVNYFVKGKFIVRGKEIDKEIRMDVPRNDVGMYDVLDMVFEDRGKVELCKIAKINRDLATNRKTTTYRYEVVNEAGDLKARVIPSGESNSALLDKLFNDLQAEVKVEDEDNEDSNEN